MYGYYDIVHWNSIEPAGPNAVLASFRYLDAVYKISETTGNIVWKLAVPYAAEPHGARRSGFAAIRGSA